MNGKGKLRLDFFDVYGNRPADRADVSLKHTVLAHAPRVRDHNTTRRLQITELDSTQGGMYHASVFLMRHRPVGRFVRIREDKTTREAFVLPINPDRVSRIEFPAHDSLTDEIKKLLQNSRIEGHEDQQGEALYSALDDIRKAGLLNIFHKMQATTFQNGRNVVSYLNSLTRLRGDRLFAVVDKDLRDEVKNSISSRLFDEVEGALHTPPPGFFLNDSFKTQDRYGNLQLTFFSKPETLEFVVDADIDDAQGIEHIFQVVGHALTGKETHPYDIHQILRQNQGIDTGYRLIV